MLKKYFDSKNGNNYIESCGERLKLLYHEKLLPFETKFQFHNLVSSKLEDKEFTALPMVMFLGQYSTGKTTFIKYLLGDDYPDMRIGPEPTTDKFIAIMYGEKKRIITGHAAVIDPNKPFRSLFQYGSAFLNKFVCVEMRNEILKHMTIIDTPGIIPFNEQTSRIEYSFFDVTKNLASKCDRIYIMFDHHKLDISEGFKLIIKSLKDLHHRTRFVFNKADSLPSFSFIRLYGVLMWTIGKFIHTPEMVRVYTGSFWNEKYVNKELRDLFDDEEIDLLKDFLTIESDTLSRRVNDLIIRSRTAIASAYLVEHIFKRKNMFKKTCLKNTSLKLSNIFLSVSTNCNIPLGDFPDQNEFNKNIIHLKFKTLNSIEEEKKHLLTLIGTDIPKIVDVINQEILDSNRQIRVSNGLFMAMNLCRDENKLNPFYEENKNFKLDVFLHNLNKNANNDSIDVEVVHDSNFQNIIASRREIRIDFDKKCDRKKSLSFIEIKDSVNDATFTTKSEREKVTDIDFDKSIPKNEEENEICIDTVVPAKNKDILISDKDFPNISFDSKKVRSEGEYKVDEKDCMIETRVYNGNPLPLQATYTPNGTYNPKYSPILNSKRKNDDVKIDIRKDLFIFRNC